MTNKITTEIKNFLIDKFSNENDFDNLCRELMIRSIYSGYYPSRITDLINDIDRQFPDSIERLYNALIKLKPNFKTQIDKLFEINGEFNDNISKNNMYEENNDKIKIFLSYSWEYKEPAEEIHNFFKNNNEIEIIRDTNEIKYKDNFQEFMKTIRDCDFAITLISEKYLQSENCMYEIIELLKEKTYSFKILPIWLDEFKIKDEFDKIRLIKYWNEKYKRLKEEAKDLEPYQRTSIDEKLKIYQLISIEIERFIDKIMNMLIFDYKDVKNGGYRVIIDEIKVKTKSK